MAEELEKTKEEIINTPKKTKNKKAYFFWKDKPFIWTIISFIVVFFLVISFLNIKGLTTLYSYSFGLFFGMFSIVIFVFILLIGIKQIFKLKSSYSIGVFHFSFWRLALLLVSLSLLGTAIYYAKFKPEEYGYKNAFQAIFGKWYLDYKNESTLWLPNKWTPGIIFSFIYVLNAFPGGKFGIILSFIISIVFIVIILCLFFISDNKFKSIFNKKNKNKKEVKNENLNVNLDKKDFFAQENATKETITIDDTKIVETQENYIIDLSKTNETPEKKEVVKTSINIIPDEPDFSTQEIELNSIDSREEVIIKKEIENDVDFAEIETQEIENTSNFDIKNEEILTNNDNNNVFLKQSDLIINNQKQDQAIFDKEIYDKNLSEDKTNKEDLKEKRKFTLVKDKEDLF